MSEDSQQQPGQQPAVVISRSGPTRQLIKPTEIMLKDCLEDISGADLQIHISQTDTADDNIAALENLAHLIHNFLKRIDGAVKLLDVQNQKWQDLIMKLQGDKLANETALYNDTAQGRNGFIATMLLGINALHMLESQLMEVEHTIAQIKRQQNRDTQSPVTPWGISPLNQSVPVAALQSNQVKMHLPKLQLPTYYGDPQKWTEYWDAYEAAVHTQNIPNVQKFSYLLSTVKGAAYKAIEGMAVTNANYLEAIDVLKNRFGNSKVIKQSLYAELRNLPVSSSKTIDLRHTLEGVERVCRQLKALGEDLDHPMLVIQIQEKMPANVLLELGKLKDPDEMWKIDELREELNKIVRIKEEMFQILQNSPGQGGDKVQRVANKTYQKLPHSSVQTFAAVLPDSKKPFKNFPPEKMANGFYPCAFCNGNHPNDKCSIFESVPERSKKVRELKLCFRCLRSGHFACDCRSQKPCIYCNGNHNRALCEKQAKNANKSFVASGGRGFADTSKSQKEAVKTESHPVVENFVRQEILDEENFVVNTSMTETAAVTKLKREGNHVALLTAKVQVQNPEDGQKMIEAYAFFDSGSQRSFVTNQLLQKLQLPIQYKEVINVNTFGSKASQEMESSKTEINIQLQTGSLKNLQVNAVKKLTDKLKVAALQTDDWNVITEIGKDELRNQLSFEERIIAPDILIGADYFWEFLDQKAIRRLPSGLHLVPSIVGLLVSGRMNAINAGPAAEVCTILNEDGCVSDKSNLQLKSVCLNEKENQQLNHSLESFWNLETIGIKDSPEEKDDDEALKRFNDSIQFKDGRYEVKWPWKSESPDLPENFGLALGRLKSLMRRFQDDPELLKKYNDIIQEQLDKGIIEKVDEAKNRNLKHYLPHHAVITPSKTTTKVRIVYDASARMKKGANSLNDCLYRGPIIMPDLCGMLIRFRMHEVALIADVEKAFLQISLQESDRDVTRFLWLKDPTKPDVGGNLQIYRFCRVAFGVISSPFLLNATLQYHLKQENSEDMLQLAENTYVDNVIVGATSTEHGLKIYREAKECFSKVSMNLREWTSNSKNFCDNIPNEDLLQDESTKVLGILWNTSKDTLKLQIEVKDGSRNENEVITKRNILKQVASTFDPLGFLSPVLLNGKKMLQLLWQEKFNWDQQLPEDKVNQWKNILHDWYHQSFYVHRPVPHAFGGNIYELVTFVDASADAYAAVVYLKTEANSDVTTHIVFSKNRLAPQKRVTIPRLELMATVIGVRATKFVEEQIRVPISKKTVFTDSECVLHWLTSKKPLGVFVENRLKELHAQKDINFCYVPSKENPADIATRGISASELAGLSIWWNGPEWLKRAPECWPPSNLPPVGPEVIEKSNAETPVEVSYPAVIVQEAEEPVIDLNRISNLVKARRVAVYALRYLKLKIWNKVEDKRKLQHIFNNIADKGEIEAREIEIAERMLIKQVQIQEYPELVNGLKSKKLHSLQTQLGVKLDKDGLLRCYGRLQNAPVSNDTKFPILLPKRNALTKLIILDVHKSILHSGTNHTLSEIRRKFWIPQGRSEVKRVLYNCFICRRYRVGPYQLPKMPPFPEERVKQAKPFQYTGLDYLGPLWVKYPKEEKKQIWICLFTCLVTRAVHLEPVIDLSVQTFLNCMRRFIARRGKPDKIISDNAAQFKITQQVMRNVWSAVVEDPTCYSYFSSQKIHWQYITEYAPWQGGFYERLVGLVKNSLRKVIGRQLLTYEDFCTLLTEVEAILNTCPLTYAQEDVDSYKVLRPVDFLCSQGEIGVPTVDESFADKTKYPKPDSMRKLHEYWQKNLSNLESFWKIWQTDYLLSLRERMQNWHKGPRINSLKKPTVDDVVLVKDEDLPRGLWKVGKIVETKEGSDKEIRTVKVLLPNRAVIQRTINFLYPLETNILEEQEEDSTNQTNTHSVLSVLFSKLARKKLSSTNIFTLTLILYGFCIAVTSATIYGQHVCRAPLAAGIHSQECVSKGIVVKKTQAGTLCWLEIKCPDGNHLHSDGSCGQKCLCPDWAMGCSMYKGPEPKTKGEKSRIIALEEPNICSFKRDPNCNEHPVHTTMQQIMLYDNTTHLVKNLRLAFSTPTEEDFICVGEGPQVGTPEFCKKHNCAASGTRFCYYPQNEIVRFIDDDGEIPVRAWGSVFVTYYGMKDALPENPSCLHCQAECIKGGVQIVSDENVGLIEVCSKPYCYKISHPKPMENVQFPKDVIINEHEFEIRTWSNGYLIKHYSLQCAASAYCEMINCYFCKDMLGNPQCAPKSYLILFFVALYFLTGVIYFLVRLAKYLFQACLYGSYFTFQCLKWCKILCHRAKSATYTKVILPIQLADQERNGNREIILPRRSNSQFQYRPTPKSYSFLAVVAVLSIVNVAQLVNGCAEVVTLTAQQSVCSVHSNGGMECVLTEATRLALVPQGQDACMLIKDPNGEPMGTMAVEVEKITVACRVKNEYFTRSFAMKVESSKRCPNMGSCIGNKCGDITTESKVDELKGEANKSPGFTYCSESCGCAACGCFYCTSACMFYRTYATPVTDTVYEVFSCPVWEYRVAVTVRLNLQKEAKQQKFDLRPGIPVDWQHLKLSLISLSSPPVPVLGSQFLTDGVKTVMVRASASGQPVSNTVGQMQCATREKASKFDCYLPHDSCVCTNRENQVACSCAEHNLEKLFTKIEHVIPLTSQGISIIGSGTSIEAEYSKIASLELQVSMEGFRLSTKMDKNKCDIKPLEFGGCYSCFTGAKLKFQCKTDFGEALAHITCGVASFSTTCTPDGVSATATLNFPTAAVKETCTVSCPAETSTFLIDTTLVFIEKERVGDLTNIISVPNAAGNVDYGFLAGWLSGNWLASIPIIIAAVILFLLTLLFFPSIVQCSMVCLSKLQSKLIEKGTRKKGKLAAKGTKLV